MGQAALAVPMAPSLPVASTAQGEAVENPQEQLLQGTHEFSAALRCLTVTVERHTTELNQSFDALQRISDSVPALLDIFNPDTPRQPNEGGSCRFRSPGLRLQ